MLKRDIRERERQGDRVAYITHTTSGVKEKKDSEKDQTIVLSFKKMSSEI